MNTGRAHVAKGHRGFSLLEVVLVLAIMSIVAVIAVPRYARALSRYRAETAARRLAADLEYARTLAHDSSGTQIITFDAVADTYTLTGRDDPDRPGRPYTVDLAGGSYRADLTSVDFAGTATVSFDAYRTPDKGGSVLVTAGDYAFVVQVDEQSGDVTLTGPLAH